MFEKIKNVWGAIPAKARLWLLLCAASIAGAAVKYGFEKLGVEPPVLPPIPLEVSQDGPPAIEGPQGWISDPDAVEINRGQLLQPWLSDTPAGRVVMGDDKDVFLWKASEKVRGSLLPARNQGDVGSCVSFGTATALEYLLLVQIANGQQASYRDLVQEHIYAVSRIDVGKGQVTGDGSLVSWAAEGVQEHGTLERGQVGNYDLSNYDEARCRRWGNEGVPKELRPIAREHLVKQYTYVKTTDELDRALAQGYTIAIGSSLGVGPQRDGNGFAKWDRRWAHAMSIIGKRTDNGGGYYFMNSWATGYHRGPLGPGNPPEGGFWLRKSDMARLLSVRDTECIAYSNAVGFPVKLIDWTVINTSPADELRKRLDPRPLFALAP